MGDYNTNLIYALHENRLVHVSQVDRGLECGCICPSCAGKLVAKKGNKVMHHFSHYNGESCQYGYQTSLHLAAKEIIEKTQRMWVPEVRIRFDSGKPSQIVREEMEIEITDVRIEKALGDIIPDIIIISGNRTYLVEITVTHSIDDVKLEKIRRLNMSTLEIDLAKLDRAVTDSVLYDILVGPSSLKKWKYSALEEAMKEKYLKFCDRYKIIMRGYAAQIERCPMEQRVWKGLPYANYTDDCTSCEFYISDYRDNKEADFDNGGILCSGKARVAELEDFRLSFEERQKKYDAKRRQEIANAIDSNACPYCGSALKFRSGQFGAFLGCGNYPHCRFTLNIDAETGEIVR